MPMHNLIEYSSNSETTGSLWFYLKDEATDFNADIANDNIFKSFKYKAKLLGSTVGQPNSNQANGIFRNVTITVPLKYLSNFWRSLEMPLINGKVDLKLSGQIIVFCLQLVMIMIMNNNDNGKNTIYTIKDTKLYVPVLTRNNQKLSKII